MITVRQKINLANFNYLKYNTDDIGLLTTSKPFYDIF